MALQIEFDKKEPIPGTIKVESGLVGEVVTHSDNARTILYIAQAGEFAGKGYMDPDARLIALTSGHGYESYTPNDGEDLINGLRARTQQSNGIRVQKSGSEHAAYGLFVLSGNNETNNILPVEIQLTQDLFAQWQGIARESLNKEFSRLRYRGILLEGGPITIAQGKRSSLLKRFRK